MMNLPYRLTGELDESGPGTKFAQQVARFLPYVEHCRRGATSNRA